MTEPVRRKLIEVAPPLEAINRESARPEEFPTHESQDGERERLFELIEKLVKWENAIDETLLAQAHAEILSHGFTGTNRERPALREALAACRQDDTGDHLGRSMR